MADGLGSVLKWTASYEANWVPDAQVQSLIDSAIYRTLCVGGLLRCPPDPAAGEIVEFQSASMVGHPVTLRGYLRRPAGAGPFPAVVLLHPCSGFAWSLDQKWGAKLSEWGYVTLTVDRFSGRGLKNSCRDQLPIDASFEAYRALDFLAQQPSVRRE